MLEAPPGLLCPPTVDAEAQRAAEVWRELTRELSDFGTRFLTLVRDPVERTLSAFSFRRDWHAAPDVWADLRTFASHPYIRNFQTAMLAGKRLPMNYRLREEVERTNPPGVRPRAQHRCLSNATEATADDLSFVQHMAAATPSRYGFGGPLLLGATEHFEASVRLFAQQLRFTTFDADAYGESEGFGPRPQRPAAAASSARRRAGRAQQRRGGDRTRGRLKAADVPEALRREIRAMNDLDTTLHELAVGSVRRWAATNGRAL